MWRCPQCRIALFCTFRNAAKGHDELIHRRLALGLGRFNQHGPMNHEWKVHCHGVETLVDQPLGHVQCGETLREALVAQKRLRSEEHTSELQSLMRISYAVFCLKKKKYITTYKQ